MSSAISLSEAPVTGIGRLLRENTFYVPTHQRDYRWDEDRVRKFFDDIEEAQERGDKFYFIGLMVFMLSDEGRLRVLDGQQRLATAIIIFSALRAWFATSDSKSTTASDIQSDFIGRADYGETSVKPKLSLNMNNNERFQRFVTTGSPIAMVRSELKSLSKNAPNREMLNAISYCHARVEEIAGKLKDEAANYLVRLLRFVRDHVVVVRLTVPNEANAFRVFETLNDRGLDLSSVDLLKNHLFGLAHEESPNALNQIEHRWAQLTQELNNIRQSDFLKAYWTSRYGRTQLDQIFDDAKIRFKTAAQAQDLTIDLLEASEQFVALGSSEDPIWSAYTKQTRERIKSLDLLGSKQVYPVLLSALKRFSTGEFDHLARLLEVVIVRWQLIGGERTGLVEINCAKLAEQIWSGAVTSAAGARDALDSIYTSDGEFKRAFAEKDGLGAQKASYLLRTIEEHERRAAKGRDARELDPGRALTLEHILPKNPGDAWRTELDADPAFATECTLRLGNFCLLTEPRNREAARRSYGEKKGIYAASELLITRKAGSYALWDRQNLTMHQHWLASRAVGIWRFP